MNILQVSEKEVAKSHRELFGVPYYPVSKIRLPRLAPDAKKEGLYIHASETGIRYEKLRLLYASGWIDFVWIGREPYITQDSLDMYRAGIKKYMPLKRVPSVVGAPDKYIQAFVDNYLLPIENRAGRDFVNREVVEKFKQKMCNWVTISEAARRLYISREQLRRDVNKAGLKIVKYGNSHLIRWDEIKEVFSRFPNRRTLSFISPARLKRILKVDGDLESFGFEYKKVVHTPLVTMRSVKNVLLIQKR